ncbi:FecR domain-containing protein [uncultured Flavobacterium sp.]|uniref:FecR family protein n=1 Tax=uncultured Flavobacterium sp. TaxID=165435 RepID=UPI0025F5AE69|nr:FecR domain-containing protein [uncultured Flavobacterium sp.]
MDNKTDKKNWQGALWLGEFSRRYFQGSVLEKEKEVFEKWNPEGDSPPDLRLFGVTEDTERNWDLVSSKINPQEATGRQKKKAGYKWFAAAAAILLLFGAGLYYAYTGFSGTGLQPDRRYYASGPGIRQYTLADGSVVSLNKDTRLSVMNGEFNDDKREIWLEEGEAFFEVAHNPDKPFIVHTQTIMTTVKGTSFNIKAYKELEDNVLSVKSGKVQVSLDDRVVGDFTKNKRMTFHKSTGQIERDELSWEDAAAWKEGRLVLHSANVNELKLRLRQQFGVIVNIEGNALKNTLLNASYPKGAKLETVLEGIGLVYNVKYSIAGDEVTIHN